MQKSEKSFDIGAGKEIGIDTFSTFYLMVEQNVFIKDKWDDIKQGDIFVKAFLCSTGEVHIKGWRVQEVRLEEERIICTPVNITESIIYNNGEFCGGGKFIPEYTTIKSVMDHKIERYFSSLSEYEQVNCLVDSRDFDNTLMRRVNRNVNMVRYSCSSKDADKLVVKLLKEEYEYYCGEYNYDTVYPGMVYSTQTDGVITHELVKSVDLLKGFYIICKVDEEFLGEDITAKIKQALEEQAEFLDPKEPKVKDKCDEECLY